MRVDFEIIPHTLHFKFEAGTSRGSFTEKETWFIKAYANNNRSTYGIGEASPLKGLSIDYSMDYGQKISALLDRLSKIEWPESEEELLKFIAKNTSQEMPSVRFGIETALLDLINGGKRMLFDASFSRGIEAIPINGWYGWVS